MAEADRIFGTRSKRNEIGYRATWVGANVTRESARIEPINPTRQAQFEALLWELRPSFETSADLEVLSKQNGARRRK